MYRHLLEPVGRRAQADALALREGEDPRRVVGVDDQRPAVAHLPPALQQLRAHLDPLHVETGIEDLAGVDDGVRSEEHTTEPQSLMRNEYDVFCLQYKNHYS